MQDSIIFQLQDPIEKVHIKVDGQNEIMDLTEIYLQAPSFRQKNSCIILKKKYMEAMFGLTQAMSKGKASKSVESQEGKEKDKKEEEKEIKFLLNASKDFDIIDFYNEFNKFFASGVAYKDNSFEQKLLLKDIEKLSERDQENIVVKYIQVFFASLWMSSFD